MPFVKKLDVLIREFGDYVEFQNDIWAESTFLGMWWTYYACLDGIIYNITEWANCPVSLMNITCIRLRLGRFTLCNGGYGFLFFLQVEAVIPCFVMGLFPSSRLLLGIQKN